MRRLVVLSIVVFALLTGMGLATAVSRAAVPAELVTPVAPFPRLLQSVAIADDAELRDFRFDARAHKLYVTDTDDRLTILDSDTYAFIATLPVGGDLLLDERNARLFAYPGWRGPQDGTAKSVTVIDTRTNMVVAALPDASFVTVDPVYGRIFTGAAYSSYQPNNTTPVRVFDATTLEVTGVISTTGIPIYNPMRRDLIILAYRAFTIDMTSGEEAVDILPEQTSHPFEFCNGCDAPVAAHVFPERNLLTLRLQRIATGGGGGTPPALRYFDATTLRALSPSELDLMAQTTCSTQPVLTPAIDGRLYENRHYMRYIFLQNWLVNDTGDNRLALRDGVYANFVNPSTRQAIIDQGYVVDLASLLPVGRFPAFCWFAYDTVSGQFFGRSGGTLLIMAETGGTPEPPEPPLAADLPSAAIAQIVPSPDVADDGIVFLSTYGGNVLRSGDGGETWAQLRGGLPHVEALRLTLAVSPDFGRDQTIFAGGAVRMERGEGVLRSTDGGDTWSPQWQGMDYLRVQKVAVSPTFAQDQRVFAQVEYHEIQPWQDGAAIYASADGGVSWSLAFTSTGGLANDAYRAKWAELAEDATIPVRFTGYANSLEVTQDGGSSWRSIDLGLEQGDYLHEIAVAPDYPTDPAIYVRTRLALFRTEDDGQTWMRWDDPRLQGRDYTNDLSAIALGRGSEGHIVFLGTTNGEFWRMAGTTLTMTPVAATVLPEPSPTPAPTATPVPTPTPVLATPEPLAAEPPAGLYRPEGPLAGWWEADADLQARLGWATAVSPEPVNMAQQAFATGVMLWREDTRSIYVLADDGGWMTYPDTFVEGEPESDPSLTPPAGYLQPIRGFGKVWREHADVRARLGWAMTPEGAVGGELHGFERGVLIGTGVRTFALIEETPQSGAWK